MWVTPDGGGVNLMKNSAGYIIASIFNFIGGICFFVAAVLQEKTVAKYGFLVAAIYLCISGAGFLYTHFRNKEK